MRLTLKTSLVPPEREPTGSFTGWHVPGTPWLAEATENRIRLWDTERGRMIREIRPEFGPPNGGIIVLPPRVVTVHADGSVVAWDLPELKPFRRIEEFHGREPGIQPGSDGRKFLTFVAEGTPGLSVWDANLQVVARWDRTPRGEPFLAEDRGWILDSRCRIGEPGVEIRRWNDGALIDVIADDAPVTHMIRRHNGKFWLFQEEGIVEIWDLDAMERTLVSLGHPDSIREDFPSGCVVCADQLDSRTVAALTADGVLGFYSMPRWEPLYEIPFENAPSWIDVGPHGREIAVGFFRDEIQLFGIKR